MLTIFQFKCGSKWVLLSSVVIARKEIAWNDNSLIMDISIITDNELYEKMAYLKIWKIVPFNLENQTFQKGKKCIFCYFISTFKPKYHIPKRKMWPVTNAVCTTFFNLPLILWLVAGDQAYMKLPKVYF